MRPRLISLDFDGVLHSSHLVADLTGAWSPAWLEVISIQRNLFCHRSVLEALLVDHQDVMLAVHSSWRRHVPDSTLRSFLGPELAQRFVGVTRLDLPRQAGIEELAARAGVDHRHLLAIDDDRKSFNNFAPLLLVDPVAGISTAQRKIAAWLAETAETAA